MVAFTIRYKSSLLFKNSTFTYGFQFMTPDSPQALEVRVALDELIHSASNFDFTILELIYHDEMSIYLIDGNLDLHRMDKAGFIEQVIQGTESAETPNIWAKFHLVEADDTNGHVIISRKVNLTGKEQIVTLSIDLVYEDDRWQIIREVIFAG